MTFKSLILSALVSAIVALVVVHFSGAPVAPAPHKETAYERVLRTGVIRCGYFVVPPEFIKDTNTKKFSGISYDITEAVGKLLGLRIDWVEEVGFGEMAAGLAMGRYDAVCSSVFNHAPLARGADFTTPFMYTPVGIFVRADDDRFDNNLEAINDPSVTVATIDGNTANEIADQDFPKSQRFSMPQNTNVSMLLENVAARKADIAFTYAADFYRYDQANPGKLKSVHPERPVRAFGNTIMVPLGEHELKDMLNTALNELLNSGTVESIIAKYEPYKGAYYRVQTAFRAP